MKAGLIIRETIRVCGLDRLLPAFTQHKDVNSWVGKITPENIQYSSGSIRQATRGGLRYELDLSDYQEWLIYYGFTNDTPVMLSQLVKPDYNVMDIGANVGQSSLRFSRQLSPGSTIWAFEPNSVNFRKCQKNIALSACKNIQVFHVGLGAKSQTSYISSSNQHHRGSSHISQQKTEFTEEIHIIALDDFVKEHRCRVHLIKIDVEGYENEVIKGARQTIREQEPILFMEVDDSMLRKQNSSAKELIAQLLELNYAVCKDGTTLTLNGQEDFSNCHMDIYAIPIQRA